MRMEAPPVLAVDSIVTRFGAQRVHDGVSFAVRRGEVVALIGGSGSGKSVLLREIVGLQRPTAGRIEMLGTDVWHCSPADLNALRRRFVEEGVWVRPFADVVYLMPPLVIGEEDLATLTGAVRRVVAEWSRSR